MNPIQRPLPSAASEVKKGLSGRVAVAELRRKRAGPAARCSIELPNEK
jgi:hypothetical protein